MGKIKKEELNLIQQDWDNVDNYCWVIGNFQFTILALLLYLKIFVSEKQNSSVHELMLKRVVKLWYK